MAIQTGQNGEAQDIIKGVAWYAADAGASDAYAIALPVAPSSLDDGLAVRFKANTANTGPATLNVNSLGATAILRPDGTALQTGDIVAGQVAEVIYRNGSFYLLSPFGKQVIRKCGSTTRAGTAASGDQTIAHGLGRSPEKVRVTVRALGNDGGTNHIVGSDGSYDGSTQGALYFSESVSGHSAEAGQNTANIVEMHDGSASQIASVTVDATNITLSWTKTGTGISGTMYIHWEAEA